jgi:predicted Fe-S protein YdhL (DUF1289 family)
MSVPSPCVDICQFDRRTGFCFGCLRTLEEAYCWHQMTDNRRRQILVDVVRRRAEIGSDKWSDKQRRRVGRTE